MKKKFLALTLALALTLSLAACGGKDAPAQDGGSPEVSAPGEEGAGSSEVNTPEGGENAPSEDQKEIDLAAFYETLRAENTWPELMNLESLGDTQEILDNYYPGLSEISKKQCGVYVAAISAAVGEIALVEVENAEDVQAVEDIFQARIDYQVGDDENPGGAWYPETIEGWKNKSRIVSHGNYVMLAVGNPADAAAESFEALFA